jgi:hypothetical protein
MGRLDVAKWLLQVAEERGQVINISAQNDEAFRLACDRRHLDVALFLETLNPKYEIINRGTPDWSYKIFDRPKSDYME